jgi:hypothetical protein
LIGKNSFNVHQMQYNNSLPKFNIKLNPLA